MKWRGRIEKRLEAVEKMASCRHGKTRLEWGYIGVGRSCYGKEICDYCEKTLRIFKNPEEFLREQLRRKHKEAEALRKELDEITKQETQEESDAGQN